MAKLKLTLTGTPCDGVYPIIDISFNGELLESNLQLSASSLLKTYDVTDSATNTLVIDNVNNAADWVTNPPPAHFENNMVAIVSGMEYAANGTNFKTYITQSELTYTMPSGSLEGFIMYLATNFSQWNVYETDYTLTFDSVGLITATSSDLPLVGSGTPNLGLWRLVGDNFYSFADGHTYDSDGNIVG